MSTTTLEKPPDTQRGDRRWWWALAVAGLAVVVAAALVAVVLTRPGGNRTVLSPPSAVPSAQPSTAAQVPPPATNPTGAASPSPAVPRFRYLPLWPFDSVTDAVKWQQAASPGGHQPWHLSPDQTALAFTNGYLQFATIDRVIGTSVVDDEAWVRVGYRAEAAVDVTAAILHLARVGSGDNRPWEVVGTRDTSLTLTTPAYGIRVSSPLAAGGRITGIDESLRVQVRGTGSSAVLGEVAGIGAGGQNQPWSATVPFRASTGTVRTIIVSTDGHAFPGVERFAITGVQVG